MAIGYRVGYPEETDAAAVLHFEYEELQNDHILDDVAAFLKVSPRWGWKRVLAVFTKQYPGVEGVWLTRKPAEAIYYYAHPGEGDEKNMYRVQYDPKNIVSDLGSDGVFVINHGPINGYRYPRKYTGGYVRSNPVTPYGRVLVSDFRIELARPDLIQAFVGKKFMGYLLFDIKRAPEEAYIQMISVAPEYRGKGAAEAMLRMMAEKYPQRRVVYGDKTDQGEAFVQALAKRGIPFHTNPETPHGRVLVPGFYMKHVKDATNWAHLPGKPEEIRAFSSAISSEIGFITYTIDEPKLIRISVLMVGEGFKRKGVAEAMLRYLAELHPGRQVIHGDKTPEGKAFIQALQKRGIDPTHTNPVTPYGRVLVPGFHMSYLKGYGPDEPLRDQDLGWRYSYLQAYDGKNKEIGALTWYFNAARIDIEYIWVYPEYRSKGVAWAMLSKMASDLPGRRVIHGHKTPEGRVLAQGFRRRGIASHTNPTRATLAPAVADTIAMLGKLPSVARIYGTGSYFREKVRPGDVDFIVQLRIPFAESHDRAIWQLVGPIDALKARYVDSKGVTHINIFLEDSQGKAINSAWLWWKWNLHLTWERMIEMSYEKNGGGAGEWQSRWQRTAL
jgi:ribosomal protein S18 acetylase RimI-like enzyme